MAAAMAYCLRSCGRARRGEARIPRQARIAREERARAEKRFNDVRRLANSLIFELHDSIQICPVRHPPENC